MAEAEARVNALQKLISDLPDIPSDDEEYDREEEELAKNIQNVQLGPVDLVEQPGSAESGSKFSGPDFLNNAGTVSVTKQGVKQKGHYAHETIDSFDKLPLDATLRKGLIKMGFVRPSKIQAEGLHVLLQDSPNSNVVGMAHHGSGKTATFLLAALSKVNPDDKCCQCVVLLPTRELAIQVAQVCDQLATFSPIKIAIGIPEYPVKRVAEQILIGTPGRILHQYCRDRNIDGSRVKLFIVDEADEMLSQGRMQRNAMAQTVFDIRHHFDKNCQVLLFSATFDDNVRQLSEHICPKPITIKVNKEEITLDGIKQFVISCPGKPERFKTLMDIYSILEIGQSIIFVNRVQGAQLLYENMTREGFKCSVIYGKGMDRKLRDKTMEDFRTGRTTVLISSDLLSRGIDVLAVTVVVNYDVPFAQDPSTYVHRIGRSGRFGRKGIAINLVGCRESMENLRSILSHYACQDKVKFMRYDDLETIMESIEKYLV